MHPRYHKNSQMILTYIGRFKPHLILEQKMLPNRQKRPLVECKMTNKPNFPPQIP